MTYADPGELAVSRMKPIAATLPAVVAARDAAGFSRLMARAGTAKELHALIAILAEAADPGRLAAIADCQVAPRIHEMHARFQWLKDNGLPVPAGVRAGERAYQAAGKRAQRSAAAREDAA